MNFVYSVIFILILCGASFAQALTEATKIDEFGITNCCDIQARVNNAEIARRNNPGSKIYFIFYEGKKRAILRWNERLGKSEHALVNPVRGEFRSFERGTLKRAAFQKFDSNNIIIKNGGYRELLTVEVWIVPDGAEPPGLTPTVDEKDVKFRKGRSGFFSHICDYI